MFATRQSRVATTQQQPMGLPGLSCSVFRINEVNVNVSVNEVAEDYVLNFLRANTWSQLDIGCYPVLCVTSALHCILYIRAGNQQSIVWLDGVRLATDLLVRRMHRHS